MEKKKQNEELQSRREFFKGAARQALPLLGLSIVGSIFLTACEKDDYGERNGCGKSCSGSCDGDCADACTATCGHSCLTYCEGTCEYGSYY